MSERIKHKNWSHKTMFKFSSSTLPIRNFFKLNQQTTQLPPSFSLSSKYQTTLNSSSSSSFSNHKTQKMMGINKNMINIIMVIMLGYICLSIISPVSANVWYDNKAITINKQRRILLSGSIHYPRSTPEVLHSLPLLTIFPVYL